jgi:outer membrane receptor protein involved in Fe transport
MRRSDSSRLAANVSLFALAVAAFPAAAQAQATDSQANQPSQANCAAISDPQQRADCVTAQNANPAPAVGAPADRAPGGSPANSSTDTANTGGIVVTGSRIRRPNLSSPVPITSVSASELPDQGQASIGDALNDLPSLRSTFSQQNSGRFIGTAGENFLDLRGLGTTRTLVLVNGRRHITASPGDFIVDVNTIPQDLIERVDIVTGGEAAIYGSDAVAGVVNFILKRNFSGIRLTGQSGITTRGDRPIDFVSLTAGQNFADGRGNIAINLEYTQAKALYQFQRPKKFAAPCGFDQTEDTTVESGTPSNSDGIPDNTFVCGIQVPGVTAGGAIGSLGNGSTLAFDRTGNLVITAPDRILPSGDVLSSNPLVGTPLNERDQLDVGQRRYTANLLAHFDVSEAFKPFVEAKFVRQKVLQEGQPTFFQGSLAGFFGNNFGVAVPNLQCSNPFLNAQALSTLQSFGICRNVATGTFGLNRFNVDFGGREELDTRDTYRIVGGVEGDFNGTWHYEISANYGHFKSDNAEANNLKLADINGNPDGFALAVDAVRNAAGQIVCRVNQVTVTRPDCVPINLFGEGAPSQAALNFINTTSHLFSHASELDLLAFVSGDSTKWFKLPGGPVGFSVGTEYRRERAFQTADPLSASGGTFFNITPTFNPPTFSVKEVFGELSLPILKDIPLARELTVSGAARYSDYNTSAGHTFAWNVNAIYSPVSSLKLRANYSKSVRVPTLNDLFSPASQNFAFLDDPCDITNIGQGNRRANCAALGVPTTTLAGSPCIGLPTPGGGGALIKAGDPFVNCISNGSPRTSIGFLSAGNPGLKAETGKSLTVGAVLTPHFLPGFSFTADYFDIKVTNLIAVLGAQTILDQCFAQATVKNQFCALLDPRTPFGLFQTPALLSAGVNFAKQTSKGVDFDLAYAHTFASGSRVNIRGLATYTIERNNFVDPTNPAFISRQLSNLGDPVFSASLITGFTFHNFTLQYTVRYIGTMTIFPYEDTHSLDGQPPLDPDISSPIRYPQVFYHDIRFEAKVNNRFRFYLGVDNVFDKLPPLGLTGTGAGGAIYNNLGRFVYGGAQVDF